MTDEGMRPKFPRSEAGRRDLDGPSDARPEPRGGPGVPRAGQAGPPAAWQPAASWLDERGAADPLPEAGVDLVNLGFIGAALRRGKRWWVGLAVAGLLLGVAVWAVRPPAPEASTTLLLDVGPEGQPGTAILNDQVVAHSRGVARTALAMLGLQESIEAFQATYQASVVTDRVLLISASAPTDGEAVRRADAIASAFLAFRADQLKKQQRLQFAALDDVVARSERDLAAIDAQISRAAGESASVSKRAELDSLRAKRARAQSELIALKGQVDSAKAAAEDTTTAMVSQSLVLGNASPVPQSRVKPLVLLSGAGFIVGLFVGAAIVILRALMSDRLRRRDDVALALGAPVRLSISARPLFRRRPGGRGMAAGRSPEIQRIVGYLRVTLPTGARRSALAVVAVDDRRVAALSVLSLAADLAKQHARVAVADLCDGVPTAKLLGFKGAGPHAVTVDSAQVEVVVPDPDDIAPVGPFSRTTAADEPTGAGQVAAAVASADVLLTLATVDPSVPSDYLRTWASHCVVVVTAGSSSWTKIHAVGELVRLAGMRLVSGVLVGADKGDESLGVTAATAGGRAPRRSRGGIDESSPAVDPGKPRSRGSMASASWVAATEREALDGPDGSDAEPHPRRRQRQPASARQPGLPGNRANGGKPDAGRGHGENDVAGGGGKTA